MTISRYFALAPALLAACALQLALPEAGLAQKPVAEVQVAPPYVTMRVGGKHKLSVLAYDADGNVIAAGVRYTWSSNNVNVVQVDSTGSVTAVAAGTAIVHAVAIGSGSPPKRGEAAIRVRRAP
jgi:uncharacterized protein YjdB